VHVCMCAHASGVAGVRVVSHTLAESEGCLPDVKSSREYPCDVVLNDVFCDSGQDFHALVTNKHQIVFW
jgi:hypothetical protein